MRIILVLACFILFSCNAFAAAEAPTADDAKALVKQAVAYAKENGKDRTAPLIQDDNAL